jgi:trimeric autotransporter adhesin
MYSLSEASVCESYLTTVSGNGAAGLGSNNVQATSANIYNAFHIATTSGGNIYYTEQAYHRVRRITISNGVVTTQAGSTTAGFSGDGSTATSALLNSPAGIAIDTEATANIYIADNGNQRVRKVDGSSRVISTVVGTGAAGYNGDGLAGTSTKLNGPVGLAVDKSNNVYIADVSNHIVRVYDVATGIVTVVAGVPSTPSYLGDGMPATSAKLNGPQSVAVDYAGNVYILDTGNNVVRVVSASTSIISTYAGNGIVGSLGDGGQASQAQLSTPLGIAVDPVGNLFIADSGNDMVRRVSAATQTISTVAGTGVTGSSGDSGLPQQAMLNNPTGVYIDNSGKVYIVDRSNQRIRSFRGSFANHIRCVFNH